MGMGVSFFSHTLQQGASACPVNRGTRATRSLLLYTLAVGAPIYRGLPVHSLQGMRKKDTPMPMRPTKGNEAALIMGGERISKGENAIKNE
jgi:hypothetical protein